MSIDLRYFQESEFQKCAPSCSSSDCREESLKRLDEARCLAGVPFRLTSAYRSPSWEKNKHRSGSGAHTKGCAFDIACSDSVSRYRIVDGAMRAGFTRIGISSSFIHLDDYEKFVKPVIWLYKKEV